MIKLLILLLLPITAHAQQWSSSDYQAGRCISVNAGGVDLSSVTTAINLQFPLAGGTVSGATTLSTTTLNWGLGLKSITLVQAQLTVPVIGRAFYCSNCVPPKVLIGTGTSAGNWADAVGAVFK